MGTTQNDLIKEYLSRGTYIFPPAASLKLTADVIAHTVNHVPKWNPVNICSYHLQEAGATPVQDLSYSLATEMAVLDAVRDGGQVPQAELGRVVGQVPQAELGRVVGRISFFVNAGIRFVEEMCKMRGVVALWDRITRERYGVEDPKFRRFRYGVQVNSLGLTEQQPENNIIRIVLGDVGGDAEQGRPRPRHPATRLERGPGAGRALAQRRQAVLVERHLVEQRAHIPDMGYRNADLAHLSGGQGMVRVVARLGREIECHAQAGLALREVRSIQLD